MRILVLSDTHGDLEAIRLALAATRADQILHLGDCAGDLFYVLWDVLQEQPSFPFRAVCGNCDPSGAAPEELTLSLEGHTLLMLHGHTRGVKYSDASMLAEAARQNADIVLYGHTHVPRIETVDKRLLINPGSAKRRFASDARPAGYAVLTLSGSSVSAEWRPLPRL